MRNNHINIRHYDFPISIIRFNQIVKYGVPTLEKETIVENVMASIYNKEQSNISSPTRTTQYIKSIVFQAPPFEIDQQTMRLIISNKTYIIEDVNYDFLTRGDIQITARLETAADYDNN